jgi:hypothetical protein
MHRGTSSNDSGKNRVPTHEKIATLPSSPESRPKSSGLQPPSSLEPIIEAPTGKFIKPRFWQLLIVFIVGVTHPRPHQQHIFCRSRSNSMDIDQPSVDRAVYYFADSFENIPRPEDHSFFKDQLRAIMIFKWMRFYCYHPKLSKGIDRPRRDELKDHLNLPPGFGQRLGSFIISKFNSFKRWGLVYAVGNGVEYHAATNIWLSRTWDGNIEQTRQLVLRDTQSPTGSIHQKRRTQSLTPERDKRQKTAMGSDVTTIRSSSITCGDSSASQTPSLPPEPRPVSVTARVSRTSQEIEKSGSMHGLIPESRQEDSLLALRSTAFMNSVPRASSTTTVSDFNTIWANPSTDTNVDSSDAIETEENSITPRNHQRRRNSPLPKNPVPDHRDLSARLEELAGEETSSRGLPSRFQGHLVSLKDKERTYKQQLNASIQELEVSRSTYKHLLKEYQSLKSELKTFALVLDKASEGENPIISTTTTLAEISEADVVKRLQEVHYNRDGTWLESKRAEKLELERKMAAQSEDKARKKIAVMEQKAKHSELLARIREGQEEHAKVRKQKAEVEDLLSGFIDVESDSSGTVSPAESISTETDEDM